MSKTVYLQLNDIFMEIDVEYGPISLDYDSNLSFYLGLRFIKCYRVIQVATYFQISAAVATGSEIVLSKEN
jgi:hypothetical protein